MRGKVQWKVQLHGISRKNTISEEALREAVGALVNHASACHMDHMEAREADISNFLRRRTWANNRLLSESPL